MTMNLNAFIPALTLLCGLLLPSIAPAGDIRHFVSGSYQQLLNDHVGKSFVLAIWSVDCPSCLKDMDVLRGFHAEHPEVELLLLSTDELTTLPQVQKLLQDKQLAELPNWIFAEEDAQTLRYEIDPAWFGELPKTYFFNSSHQRIGKSGALSKQQLLELGKP